MDWVLDSHGEEVLEQMKERDRKLFDIWTVGLQALEPLGARNLFTGVPGSSGFKLRQHIFPNPWRFVHPQSDDVLWPMENLFMNILKIEEVKIYCSKRILKKEEIVPLFTENSGNIANI